MLNKVVITWFFHYYFIHLETLTMYLVMSTTLLLFHFLTTLRGSPCTRKPLKPLYFTPNRPTQLYKAIVRPQDVVYRLRWPYCRKAIFMLEKK